jgi:hypothetical protein
MFNKIMLNLLSKIVKIRVLLLILLFGSSCNLPDNFGFYQPITLRMTVPDGPPEFKAGWYAGCKSALIGAKSFANAFVYDKLDFGSGVYQHDPVYQAAWGQSFFSCGAHSASFVEHSVYSRGPLE